MMLCVIILLHCQFSYAQSRKSNSKKGSDHNSGIEKISSPGAASNYFDLVKTLPVGYVENGSVDYTNYIQKGIDENRNVQMPNFPILINEKGLKVKSDSRIVFKNKSVLLMTPNGLSNYAIILINNVNNVVIQSSVIVGERDQHKGTTGEWGMGIFITDSKNIQIFSSTISNCWGDGIYIGGGEVNANENITITDAKIDNCRRNGISITNGKNIKILNSTISNTNGTSPMAAIDIEPNNDKSTIEQILISNVTTLNNGNYGILIALGALPAIESKSATIKIDNHIDKNSKNAFYLAGFRGDHKNKKSLIGSIEVNNPKWYNNKKTLVGDLYDLGPKTKFKNIQIFNDGSQTKNTQSNQDVQKIKKAQSINKHIIFED